MLYEQWLQIAGASRERVALRDLTTGKKWTFGEMAAQVEQLPRLKREIIFPQGGSNAFILNLLRAWRDEQVVCPLEDGQRPRVSEPLPAGIVHLKATSA